jgi:hypothetical protein
MRKHLGHSLKAEEGSEAKKQMKTRGRLLLFFVGPLQHYLILHILLE